MILSHKSQSRIRTFVFLSQLLCLLLAGVLEFCMMTAGPVYGKSLYRILYLACQLSCAGFCFVALLHPERRLFQKPLIPAAAMAIWFLIIEFLHRRNGMDDHDIFMFLAVYLLAFAFAFVAQDQTRQIGLSVVSGIYIAAAVLLLVFSFFLLTAQIPALLQSHLYWDGTRLHAIHHPNISARVLMIAIALNLGLFAKAKKLWIRVPLLLLLVLMFGSMALTNSRSCILLTCLLFGGNVFFLLFDGTWKRFLPGVAAAALTTVLLFACSSALFQWNTDRLLAKPTMEMSKETVTEAAPIKLSSEEMFVPEAVPLANSASDLPDDYRPSNQHSFLSDLVTLNSRTRIWSGVFQKLQQEPQILLLGTDNTKISGPGLNVNHTHNAWLETLLRLGLPGFVMSLYFTVQAAWSALCLLWHNSVDLSTKNIAMLSLCLLVTSMMEPLLFFTKEWAHFIDFIFFLTLGYLILWRKQLLRKP